VLHGSSTCHKTTFVSYYCRWFVDSHCEKANVLVQLQWYYNFSFFVYFIFF